jgi:hypothetical protein
MFSFKDTLYILSKQVDMIHFFSNCFPPQKLLWTSFIAKQLIDFIGQVRYGCKCYGLRGFKIRKGQVTIAKGSSESAATFPLTLIFSPYSLTLYYPHAVPFC